MSVDGFVQTVYSVSKMAFAAIFCTILMGEFCLAATPTSNAGPQAVPQMEQDLSQFDLSTQIQKRRTFVSLFLYAQVLAELVTQGEGEVDSWFNRIRQHIQPSFSPKEKFNFHKECIELALSEWSRLALEGRYASTKAILPKLQTNMATAYPACADFVDVTFGPKSDGQIHGGFLQLLSSAEIHFSIEEQKLNHLDGLNILMTSAGSNLFEAARTIAFYYMEDKSAKVREKAKDFVRRFESYKTTRQWLDIVSPTTYVLPVTGVVATIRGLNHLVKIFPHAFTNPFQPHAIVATLALHLGAGSALSASLDKMGMSSVAGPRFRPSVPTPEQREVPLIIRTQLNGLKADQFLKGEIQRYAKTKRFQFLQQNNNKFDLMPFFIQSEMNLDLNPSLMDSIVWTDQLLSVREQIKTALSDLNKPFIERLDEARKVVFDQTMISNYVRDQSFLLPFLRGEGGNCVVQTYLFLGLMWPLRDQLGKTWHLGAEVMTGHIQPVVLNLENGEIIDLVSGSKRTWTQFPVYHPAYFLDGYLHSLSAKPEQQMTQKELGAYLLQARHTFAQVISKSNVRDKDELDEAAIDRLLGQRDIKERNQNTVFKLPPGGKDPTFDLRRVPEQAQIQFKIIHNATSRDVIPSEGNSSSPGANGFEQMLQSGAVVRLSRLIPELAAKRDLPTEVVVFEPPPVGGLRYVMLPATNTSQEYTENWKPYTPNNSFPYMVQRRWRGGSKLIQIAVRTEVEQKELAALANDELRARYLRSKLSAYIQISGAWRQTWIRAAHAPSDKNLDELKFWLTKMGYSEPGGIQSLNVNILAEVYSLLRLQDPEKISSKLLVNFPFISTFNSASLPVDRETEGEVKQKLKKLQVTNLWEAERAILKWPEVIFWLESENKFYQAIESQPEKFIALLGNEKLNGRLRLQLWHEMIVRGSLLQDPQAEVCDAECKWQWHFMIETKNQGSSLARHFYWLEKISHFLFKTILDPNIVGITEKKVEDPSPVEAVFVPPETSKDQNPNVRLIRPPNLRQDRSTCGRDDKSPKCRDQEISYINLKPAKIYLDPQTYLGVFLEIAKTYSNSRDFRPFKKRWNELAPVLIQAALKNESQIRGADAFDFLSSGTLEKLGLYGYDADDIISIFIYKSNLWDLFKEEPTTIESKATNYGSDNSVAKIATHQIHVPRIIKQIEECQNMAPRLPLTVSQIKGFRDLEKAEKAQDKATYARLYDNFIAPYNVERLQCMQDALTK